MTTALLGLVAYRAAKVISYCATGPFGVVSNEELFQALPKAMILTATEHLDLLWHSLHCKVLGVIKNGHHAPEALSIGEKSPCPSHALLIQVSSARSQILSTVQKEHLWEEVKKKVPLFAVCLPGRQHEEHLVVEQVWRAEHPPRERQGASLDAQ